MTPNTPHTVGHVGWSPDYKSSSMPPVTGKLMPVVQRRLVLPGFEYEETQLQFACTHSIYTKDEQSSICYVTSEERAKFMVAALNHFKATGAMDEYLRQNP